MALQQLTFENTLAKWEIAQTLWANVPFATLLKICSISTLINRKFPYCCLYIFKFVCCRFCCIWERARSLIPKWIILCYRLLLYLLIIHTSKHTASIYEKTRPLKSTNTISKSSTLHYCRCVVYYARSQVKVRLCCIWERARGLIPNWITLFSRLL